MRMEAHLSHSLQQRMKLAPQIIQSIEILQLPILELLETVKAEQLENPTLVEDEEQIEHEEAKGIEQPTNLNAAEDPEAPRDKTQEVLEALDRQREDDYDTRPRGNTYDPSSDKKMEALMNTPAKGSSLQTRLFDQWAPLEMPEKIKRIGEYLLYNIDDNGYIPHRFDSLTDANGKVVEEGLLEGVNRVLRSTAEEFIESVRKVDPEMFAGKTVRKQVIRGIAEDDIDRELKLALLNGMDDQLNLKAPLEEILAPHLATVNDMYVALGRIQKLDPPGVGARNARECLLLQLDHGDDEYEIKKLLIEKYLDDIGQNKLPKIARETGRDMDDIKYILDQIRQLNPHPGASYTNESVPYVLPDVLVEGVEGEYIVKLEDGYIPRLCVSNYYRDLLAKAETKPEEKDFIRKKIESAKRLISSIEQRQATLYRIACELVKVQRGFLDHGVNHLHPLRMQEIADALGLHVSTVSRAISEKYIQTPRGIFPMKFFFSGATESSEGESQSRVSVQSRIKELVDTEDHASPLSDGDIVDKGGRARHRTADRDEVPEGAEDCEFAAKEAVLTAPSE
ncbi:MAG: RNA polymerase factor sigma-54 [Planctomycetes bacterium]|nr:RNA polymerase factor sigma-54 [Planctomycetota bacterium]